MLQLPVGTPISLRGVVTVFYKSNVTTYEAFPGLGRSQNRGIYNSTDTSGVQVPCVFPGCRTLFVNSSIHVMLCHAIVSVRSCRKPIPFPCALSFLQLYAEGDSRGFCFGFSSTTSVTYVCNPSSRYAADTVASFDVAPGPTICAYIVTISTPRVWWVPPSPSGQLWASLM